MHPGGVTTDTTADRAYLRQAATPADAAGRAAALHGITLPGYAAQQIADAVLGHADNKIQARHLVYRHMWEIPEAQEQVLWDMRRRLLQEVIRQECVPTALPTETITYMSHLFGAETASSSATEPAEWGQVEITLTVPVRTP